MARIAASLEPGCVNSEADTAGQLTVEGAHRAAILSTAISLKRIADLLEANLGDDARNNYGETPFEAIGAGISRALIGITR